MTMWVVAYSSSLTFLNFHWFLVDELMFIGDADLSSSLMVFFFQWRGGELFFFVASRLDGRGTNLIDTCMKASSLMTWGCHLATVVVHGLLRHSQQSTIDWCLLTQWCMPCCNGILWSLSLLPTCKMVSSKMMKVGLRLANMRWIVPYFTSAS